MDVDPHFSTQTKARKAALDILFQADLLGLDPRDVLREQQALAEHPFRPLTTAIVEGVGEHGEAIDRRIRACTRNGWTIERMPCVDRTLARIAIYEIDHSDVPNAVAIAEALELASWLSTNSSESFLNGLLGQAVRQANAD